MSARFSPDACPGCGEPLRPKYSVYRHGTRHWLFPVGLVGGSLGVLALIALSFWGAFELAEEVFGGAAILRRERGILTFLIQVLLIALIVIGARIGWRLLFRLPRTFEAACQTCTWTGPCKVYEDGASVVPQGTGSSTPFGNDEAS
jgi:hypothetical protein